MGAGVRPQAAEPGVDGGALAGAGRDGERAAHHGGGGPHADDARALGDGFRVEAFALVLHPQVHDAVVGLDGDLDLARVAVAPHVVQRLVHDLQDHRLRNPVEHEVAVHRDQEVRAQPVAVPRGEVSRDGSAQPLVGPAVAVTVTALKKMSGGAGRVKSETPWAVWSATFAVPARDSARAQAPNMRGPGPSRTYSTAAQ